jgi:hypothetical protein
MSLSIDVLSKIIMILGNSNLWLFNVLSFCEIIIFGYLYLKHFKGSLLTLVLCVLGLIYIVLEGVVNNQSDIASFQTYSRIVSSFVIVVMVLNYLFKELKAGSILKNEVLHFVILSYYSIEFMLLIPFNFLINHDSISIMYIWTIRIILNLILYSYLSLFIWKNGKILT